MLFGADLIEYMRNIWRNHVRMSSGLMRMGLVLATLGKSLICPQRNDRRHFKRNYSTDV